MKKNISFLALTLFTLAVLFVPLFVSAQANQTTEWMRVRSDDGEFSIEVPAEHAFFVDKDGFSISNNSANYALQEMKMLNAYSEKTLLSFEVYKASKKVLDAVREIDDGRDAQSSEIRRNGFRVKQLVFKNDKSYTVRQYFNSKGRIYILTAASRNGEMAAMRRFLDSLIFAPTDSKQPNASPTLEARAFSALKISQIEVEEKLKPFNKNGSADSIKPLTPPANENVLPLVISLKPKPAYTDVARMNGEKGIVRMRVTFAREGFVSKVQLLEILGHGLTRQSFFAALRLKFLPPERDGNPETVTKTIEYSFDIY